MSKCFEKYDLDPKTCKFVAKCPDRDEKFKCKPETKKKIDYEVILRKRVDDLRDLFKSKTNVWKQLRKKIL